MASELTAAEVVDEPFMRSFQVDYGETSGARLDLPVWWLKAVGDHALAVLRAIADLLEGDGDDDDN
ncbi:hypothetical protein [Gordonia soli]|uniref:Uncharacterized protein n=1 Tax=Gordonia soli NBRC 108243 TaxID=1223545 RepID=M0QPX8_9ACTN|nr:hypothetical protein [Gordonia soli]GAC70745.1 hypothetical protein GS4_40_00110 [Gordonia soli NBRC 108243]